MCLECYVLALEHCADLVFEIGWSRKGPIDSNTEKHPKHNKKKDTMKKVLMILCLFAIPAWPQAEPPIVFHVTNTRAVPTEDRCVGNTCPPFVPAVWYFSDVYLTGGSGNLWPTQAKPATMISFDAPMVDDGRIPNGYRIDPKSGLIHIPTDTPATRPAAPTNLRVLISMEVL